MVAPTPSPRPDTRVGGKGSALTSDAVYSVSRGVSSVRIDASALEKLQLSSPSSSSAPLSAVISAPTRLLGHELSRAALLVLLGKLVNADSSGIRQATPLLIEEALNVRAPFEKLDFGTGSALLSSLLELNGKCPEEIAGAPTADEAFVIENSSAASVAICAVLDCVSSSLSTVLDAVAALSCEAARADVSAFDMYGSGDGFSVKDETDVAGDLKMLLSKSKMTGQVEDVAFVEIPTVNGSFREAVRLLHSRTRVELNSVVKARKTSVSGNNGKERALAGLALHLAAAISAAGESSLRRIRAVIGSIADKDLKSRVVSTIQNGLKRFVAPNHADLDAFIDFLSSGFQINSTVDALHSSYELLVKLQEIIAWETALALYLLETDDSVEKAIPCISSCTEVNGENAKGDKKAGKKKKKTLGNGTSIIRQLLAQRLAAGEGLPDLAVLTQWARELSSFFDPKDPGLDDLLSKTKEIVQSNDIRRLPKIPKGTRDCGKEEMAVREHVFSIILGVFKRHGAVGLDTPVFELRETLMGKYGEDSKLIFDLADQGGEICSLRYDLTVPFARYLACNSITALKRYQIGKVYRRDNPSRGRFREFYQCDFDIAGTYGAMEADFEVVKVLTELLNELEIGDYEVKLNHRMLLDGMLEICGVPSEKFRTVCSSIDKLDKQPFEQIKKELVEEKGLTVDIAERIGVLVKKRGSAFDILSDLMGNESPFLKHTGSLLALKDLEILFKALEKAKALDKIVFDLSLARGLDYYTGVIFEAVLKGSAQVGSIAAGGRYDNLVGMFSGKQVPAVGISLGIERVFTIMREQKQKQEIRSTETVVLVAVLGQDLTVAAELVSELWNARIPAEFSLNKRMDKHIKRAENGGIPWMVIIGDLEKAQGIVKLKDFNANKEESISRDDLVVELQKRLSTQPGSQRYAIA